MDSLLPSYSNAYHSFVVQNCPDHLQEAPLANYTVQVEATAIQRKLLDFCDLHPASDDEILDSCRRIRRSGFVRAVNAIFETFVIDSHTGRTVWFTGGTRKKTNMLSDMLDKIFACHYVSGIHYDRFQNPNSIAYSSRHDPNLDIVTFSHIGLDPFMKKTLLNEFALACTGNVSSLNTLLQHNEASKISPFNRHVFLYITTPKMPRVASTVSRQAEWSYLSKHINFINMSSMPQIATCHDYPFTFFDLAHYLMCLLIDHREEQMVPSMPYILGMLFGWERLLNNHGMFNTDQNNNDTADNTVEAASAARSITGDDNEEDDDNGNDMTNRFYDTLQAKDNEDHHQQHQNNKEISISDIDFELSKNEQEFQEVFAQEQE